MKASTSGICRKLCARATRRTSTATPTGIAHNVLIQRRPMRIRGTMPSCGGSQWLKTIRLSAALKVEARGSCGGSLIVTESVIGLASLGKYCRPKVRPWNTALSVSRLDFLSRPLSQKKTPQCDGVVVNFVVSRVDERDRALSCQGRAGCRAAPDVR